MVIAAKARKHQSLGLYLIFFQFSNSEALIQASRDDSFSPETVTFLLSALAELLMVPVLVFILPYKVWWLNPGSDSPLSPLGFRSLKRLSGSGSPGCSPDRWGCSPAQVLAGLRILLLRWAHSPGCWGRPQFLHACTSPIRKAMGILSTWKLAFPQNVDDLKRERASWKWAYDLVSGGVTHCH